MVVIGIAGGTGKLGRAIVDELKDNPKHSVKVLSRKANPELAAEIGVHILAVDYGDIDSLVEALEEHQVHTIISSTSLSAEQDFMAQINLIKAAAKSSATKRFAPSEFGQILLPEHAISYPLVKGKLLAVEELKKTDLEYTLFSNGFFLDYYAIPGVKSYMKPFTFAVDIANGAAAIPGSGETPIVFTHTFDVAKYVAASLDLPKWPERSIIIGDKVTWNQFVKLAEDARGIKFTITYDSIDKLKSFQVTELPSHPALYTYLSKERLQYMLAVFGMWTDAGYLDLPADLSLNSRFPDIKPLTVHAMLEKAWKGK